MRVRPDDGDAGLRPQTRGERTGAGKTIRFDDARVGTHSRLVHITLQAANRFLGRNARHGKSPLASYMEEINIAASVFASRIGPPYWPECTGCSNALTCTSISVLPRSDVVSDGISADQLPESATMITSEANSSRCSSMNGMKLGEPSPPHLR